MRPLLLLLSASLLVSACRCGDPGLGTVEGGFRVEVEELDFGRVLEGSVVVRELELISTGRGDVTVEVQVEPPFTAPAEILVPGGSSAFLKLTFVAENERVERPLTLIGLDGEQVVVTLRGEGVRPLVCIPSAPCRISTFDLQTISCIETVGADGSACTPASVCLENGQCQMGECVGTPRACDDGNLCTRDGCSEATGCVNVAIDPRFDCPAPSAICKRAICTPSVGCGEADQQDATLCGPADCTRLNWCIQGECLEAPTPLGTPCGLETPCTDRPTCGAVEDGGRECIPPEPFPMMPLGQVALPSVEEDSVVLRATPNAVFLSFCGSDGGDCTFSSYTVGAPMGDPPPLFERYTTSIGAAPATLAGISDAGALLARAESLGLYGAGGVLRWDAGLPSSDGGVPRLTRESLALSAEGEVAACVGTERGGVAAGTSLARYAAADGALTAVGIVDPTAAECRVALSADGSPWVLNGDGTLYAQALDADGGATLVPVAATAEAEGLIVRGDQVIVGGRYVYDIVGEQLQPLPDAPEDAGFSLSGVFPRPVLAANGQLVRFINACPAEDCDAGSWLGFDVYGALSDPPEQALLLPPEAQPRLVEAAIVSGGATILTLTEGIVDGGSLNVLQFFNRANSLGACELAGHPRVLDAVFIEQRLFAIVEEGGATTLRAYTISPLNVARSGWPIDEGLGGRRSDTMP